VTVTRLHPTVPPAASCGGDDDRDLHGYASLLDGLEGVPDPRRRQGTRHRAAVVLAFTVVAVMAGADSVTAIAEWARDLPPGALEALGARRDRKGRLVPPSLSTFRRVLRRLDGQALAAAFGAWLAAQVLGGLADASLLVIALDGKTVRGAKTGDGKAPHLLAAMITGARAVLAQRDVDAKTNEITQVRPLLDDVDITGALVTADALHVQRDTARYLVEEKEADYLFTAVKENQPGLFAALDALAWEDAPIAHIMTDCGHGRHETRTIQVLPAPDGIFPHAAQAVLVERTVRDPHNGRLRSAVAALGVTSRPAGRGGTPEALATATRLHWDVEALHHVRSPGVYRAAARRCGRRHADGFYRVSPRVWCSWLVGVHGGHERGGFTGCGHSWCGCRLVCGTGRCWMRSWPWCRSRIRSCGRCGSAVTARSRRRRWSAPRFPDGDPIGSSTERTGSSAREETR
jgi:predicted transposase YbfD/YdcC